ncbi:MAG TPA: multidrug efflux SMR transporter [Paludibacteraceae bacterium]|jgi:quaternary ammonium compound-resistance protein SugE|nr:multidrug efflux SMR transporter [Paludibacteraceae bacterium]NCB46287.1 multidrug efflux SMR transporter [bacterium]HPL94964.1 multidrug efflux SMR transporter [Paludibacteraceae bacterium]
MNWLYLFLAGIFEIGWPLGFKLSQTTSLKAMWIIIAIISMGLSGFFLWQAQRSIPIGTAYAIWTGVGAVGTLIIGIVFFGDSASFFRLLSASLIVMGIVGLKLAS